MTSLHRHIRPAKRPSTQQHVPDERLYGSLADEPDEEELFDDVGGHGAEGGQAEEQLAEARGLGGVLGANVLLEGALGLLLDALDVGGVGQAARVYGSTGGVIKYCL